MNPATGTFITQDTYSGTIFDPTSIHKYLYANANPVMNCDPTGYFTLAGLSVSGEINNILDHSAELNYMKIYYNLKSKLNMINNVLTVYDTCRQIAMIINDPNLSGWQMVEGIACGVITGLFMNRMCQMKAIGPIISKIVIGYGLVTEWESIMEAANNKDWDLVATRSIQFIISLMSLHQNCFTGETLVAAEDRQIRIDEIEVSDKVWAYDIFTGETALKEVTKVYVHEVDEILHLHTSCGDIDTTTNHPFYVIDRGWVAAGDLIVGDEILTLDGSVAIITGSEIEKLDEAILVYNLEVADFNTYFVGDVPVLVHNYIDAEGENNSTPTQQGKNDFASQMSPEDAKAYNKFFTKDAPMQANPGITEMTGFHVNGKGRVEPWHAYYDEFGYLIARTDYNAGNKTAGIPDIHHHLFAFINGCVAQIAKHMEGEYRP